MKLVQIRFELAKAFYKFLYFHNHHKTLTITDSTRKYIESDDFESFVCHIRIIIVLSSNLVESLMSEKSKKAPARKLSKPMLSLLALAFVFFLLWLCFGITLNLRIPAQEYELARERWEASNISDYEMTIRFSSMAILADINMTIENHEVVNMVGISPLLETRVAIDLEDATFPEFSFGSSLPENLHDYEISRLLEFTGETIVPAISPEPIIFCERVNQYDIRFNQEYGFVEEISLESCPSAGLLCGARFSHCQSGFRVIEFVP